VLSVFDFDLFAPASGTFNCSSPYWLLVLAWGGCGRPAWRTATATLRIEVVY
jgi:hypothetical protein